MIKTFKWQGFTWKDRPWWEYHPSKDQPEQWHNPADIVIDEEGVAHFNVSHSPKEFIHSRTNQKITIPYSNGMMESVDSFGYGYYEAWMKIPRGENLWPAFWLYGHEDWPPEIDIFEFWTQKRRWQDPFWFNRRYMKSSIHIGSKNKVLQKPSKYPKWFNKLIQGKIHPENGYKLLPTDIDSVYHKYSMIWTNDSCKVYFDDILTWEAGEGIKHESLSGSPSMKVVIGNGVHLKRGNPTVNQPLVVKSFRYAPF